MAANKYAGTQTEKNLQECAFAGESQGKKQKYTYFASVAKRKFSESRCQHYFKETADNEKEHAKMWFKEELAGNQVNLRKIWRSSCMRRR